MSGLFSSLGGLVGGIFGDINAEGDEKIAEEYLRQTLDEYGAIDPNKIREIQAEQAGRSAMEGVNADPALIEAQRRALMGLENTYHQGGMDAEALAQMNQVDQNVAQADRARREAIVARQGRQGRGGGAAYSSMLQGTQTAAQTQNQGGYDAHAAAQRRRLQAIRDAGGMAGDMRAQGFNEGAQKAGHMDRMGQFNANLRQQAAIQNQQADAQRIDNQLKRQAGRADARGAMYGNRKDAAQRSRRQGLGYGQSVGGVMDSVLGYGGNVGF
jgi:hypothetical protein